MPKATPPEGPPLKFQGRQPYPIEPGLDDWGLTPAQQETYVELFRQALAKANAFNEEQHDYYTLRRFLRARTYELEKAIKMWLDHLEWRRVHQVDDILSNFYFHEREQLLKAYPQGYHKRDKMGRPVYIQLVGQIDMKAIFACTDEERLFKFHVQEYERCLKVIMPVCSRLADKHLDQTFGILDVRGVGLSHLTGEVKKMMGRLTKTDQDNYPECMGRVCIINAPTVFRMIWGMVKGMLDVRTQGKIEILGTNYLPDLERWIDIEDIPKFLGGKSEGTLVDDVGPWSNADQLRSMGLDLEDLRHGRISPSQPSKVTLTLPAGALARYNSLDRRTGSTEDGAVSVVSVVGFTTPTPSVNGGSSPTQSVQPHSAPSTTLGLAAAGYNPLAAIPETRAKTLLERIKAIEAILPAEMERVKGAGLALPDMGASTRSAPEGSLLARVEVLEEALDMLLQAQATLIAKQQETEGALLAEQQKNAPRKCCTIM